MNRTVVSTVIEAAVSYDLTTLAVVKDELSVSDGSRDAVLQRYIGGASAAVAQYCNRALVVEKVSDEFLPIQDLSYVLMAERIAPLQLSRWPVAAVVSVTENGAALVEGVDYRVDAGAAQLTRLTGGLPCLWPGGAITVVYSAGYDPVPPDLEDAVVRMVTKRYSAKGRDATMKAENIPGVRDVQYWIATGNEAGNLTPDIVDLLGNYRIPVMA